MYIYTYYTDVPFSITMFKYQKVCPLKVFVSAEWRNVCPDEVYPETHKLVG